jgi:uncharacterized protein YbjQ (UPF0145 family)
MKLRIAIIALAACGLTACGTFMDIEEHVSPERAQLAEPIKIYRVGTPLPEIVRTLGRVEGYSCKSEIWDPVSEKAALQQLKLRALDMGANAVIRVEVSWDGFELDNNCWKSVTTTGIAVIAANGG